MTKGTPRVGAAQGVAVLQDCAGEPLLLYEHPRAGGQNPILKMPVCFCINAACRFYSVAPRPAPKQKQALLHQARPLFTAWCTCTAPHAQDICPTVIHWCELFSAGASLLNKCNFFLWLPPCFAHARPLLGWCRGQRGEDHQGQNESESVVLQISGIRGLAARAGGQRGLPGRHPSHWLLAPISASTAALRRLCSRERACLSRAFCS